MKKQITIPMGTICGAMLLGTGVCTSVLVDRSLAKIEGNRIANSLGRAGSSVMIGTYFTALAVAAMTDDTFNIKIGGKKKDKKEPREVSLEEAQRIYNEKHPARHKDIKRLIKASDRWKSIYSQAEILNNWLSDNADDDLEIPANRRNIPEELYVSNKDVEKFDDYMEKLAKRIGFEFIPIITSDDPVTVMDDIFRSADRIIEQLQICIKYCNPDYIPDDHEDDKSDADENDRICDARPITERDLIRDQVAKIILHQEYDLKPGQFVKIMDHLMDETIKDIVQKFNSGELSATAASERIIAYIDAFDESDDAEVADVDADAEVEAKTEEN